MLIQQPLKGLVKLKKQMTLHSPRFKFRWGYEYADGTIKRGMWSNPGKNPIDQAWYNNKNIKYAFIERRDDHTADVKLIVRCPADEFLNFQWIYIAYMPSVLAIKGNVKPLTALRGLTMLTTNSAVDCFSDGTIKQSEPRHLKTNFRTYGS